MSTVNLSLKETCLCGAFVRVKQERLKMVRVIQDTKKNNLTSHANLCLRSLSPLQVGGRLRVLWLKGCTVGAQRP